MCSRISSALSTPGVLAACSEVSPSPPGEAIGCGISAGAGSAADCTLERIAGTNEIVIRHRDGGFRRLNFDLATGALASADGAESVVLEQGPGVLQFAIRPGRYRISREPTETSGS